MKLARCANHNLEECPQCGTYAIMYEYSKKHGWVPGGVSTVIEDMNGTKIRVLDRSPVVGERFLSYASHEADWYDPENKCLKLDGVIAFFKDWSIDGVECLKEGESPLEGTYTHSCTLIPCP
jgi:hypothetical protein